MKKFAMVFILGGMLLNFTGCAALFNQKEVVTPVQSSPDGAKVYVDGGYVGISPVKVKLNTANNHTVMFEKEGYEKQTYFVNKTVGVGWVVLDVFGGFIPVIVDAATGSWYELSDKNVNVVLEQTKK